MSGHQNIARKIAKSDKYKQVWILNCLESCIYICIYFICSSI